MCSNVGILKGEQSCSESLNKAETWVSQSYDANMMNFSVGSFCLGLLKKKELWQRNWYYTF
jgi:hypothetical protein